MTPGAPVDGARRTRVEALFESALARPAEARGPFLEEACGGDLSLRADVLRLLQAHERAGGVLDTEAPASAARLLDGDGPPRPGWPEERIGPYRIRDELGRGGMGIVYLAERDDGQFRRRVALKVIPAAHDEDLRARVVAERQILASLDHPGIARLLDAGVTEDGRFYLVMEHVNGLPLDLHCDRMRLTVKERLELFVAVAEAVEHAHRNLVVHRDLKPSNILVTPDGRVKLLDFGIAKLLNPGLAGVAAPVTRRGSLALTPEYASPEQLRGETLSTATDVYSLGVLLYRLLTGSSPYEVGDGSPSAVLSAMLERDPVRPSTRVTRPHEEPRPGGGTRTLTPQEIAADRRTTSGRLPRLLRGDLDAIVLKALRKEPGRRYGSAESLARDIERHLRREPVTAHRDSRGYRLVKLVRRHTFEAVAAVLLVLSLLGGVAATGWQAAVAGRERDRAAEALERAEIALGESEAVAGFLMELFWAGDPLVGGGDQITARDLVRRGVRRADELSDQPVVQARMLDVLGQIQDHFGAYGESAELLERALVLRRARLGDDHPDVAATLLNLARARRDAGRREEAIRLVREALEIRRAVWTEPHPAVAEAVFELGWLSPLEPQERLYREALEIHRAAGGDPGTEAMMLEVMATNLRRRGKLAEAVSTARRALELREEHYGPRHAQLPTALYHLGDHVRDLEGDLDEAEALYRRGIAIHTRTYGPNSLHLIHGLHSLGVLHGRRGEHAEAELLFRRLLAIRRSTTDPENPTLSRSMGYVATAVARQGRLEEAETLLREAIAHGERSPGGELDRHQNLADLGWVLSLQGRWAEADSALEAAFALRRRVGGPDDIVLHELHRRWGRMLTGAGRHAEAEPHLLEALAGLDRVYEADHPNHVDARRALHELYTGWGRPDEAAAYRVPPGVFHAY